MKWSQDDIYLFNQGTYYRAFEKLGAHPLPSGGVYFSVWVPGAASVCVAGSFNDWRPDEFHLDPLYSSGIWNGIIPSASAGDQYKFVITSDTGEVLYKADPYAFGAQLRPDTASVVTDISGFEWHDADWLEERANKNLFKVPMNIYELHLGSWRRRFTRVPGEPECEYVFDPKSSLGCEEGPDEDNFLTYREIADLLVPYIREMGYSHIELLPIAEHPFDGSWGYQVTGYFAPTARYGTAKDLMYLIDECHKAHIGVIMDWVPGHFCKDAFGLGRFNGHKLYEKKEHKEWGTYIFDYGRPETKGFLKSNAYYWLSCYHFDGIRVDGVSSMLYLNYGVDDQREKVFNKNGGEENLEAVAFLQEFNKMVGDSFPGAFTVAEESTAWPLVTYPPSDGGLGFHFKWNMGWMNDTLRYFSEEFIWRKDHHDLLTFVMMYAFSENYILPLSHDEVVHGKKSLIGRMPGSYEQQFAGLRLLAMYQMCQPGAKLSFMGNEFGQFIEWRFYEALEWFMLDYDQHRKHHDFIKTLNHLYLDTPALWHDSFGWDGFRWIDANNNMQSVLSFARIDKENNGLVICVLNMTPTDYPSYSIGVPEYGIYKEILSSDEERFGGSGVTNPGEIETDLTGMHGCEQSVAFHLPALSGIILRLEKKLTRPEPEPAKAISDSKPVIEFNTIIENLRK